MKGYAEISLDQFIRLNDSMRISHLLNAAKAVDKNWDSDDFRGPKVSYLKNCLQKLADASNPEHQLLSKLAPKISIEMSYQHFIGILIPIERQFGRSVTDHEFLVTTDDKTKTNEPEIPFYVILDNIRSAFNVGSIFRTSECFGVKKLFLCGYTSTPDQEKTKLTAMKTDETVDWEWVKNTDDVITRLKSEGVYVIGLETTEKNRSFESCKIHGPTAIVLGNEKHGIQPTTLALCNDVREIPLFGSKNSLNVGVAFGVVANYVGNRLRIEV